MSDLSRIKRNVAKMASMNAPVADIDGYIASEGVTVDDVRNFNVTEQPIEVIADEPRKDVIDVAVGDTPEEMARRGVQKSTRVVIRFRRGHLTLPGATLAGTPSRYALLGGRPAGIHEDPHHAWSGSPQIRGAVQHDVPPDGRRSQRLLEEGRTDRRVDDRHRR